jgi:hypothetical protein
MAYINQDPTKFKIMLALIGGGNTDILFHYSFVVIVESRLMNILHIETIVYIHEWNISDGVDKVI